MTPALFNILRSIDPDAAAFCGRSRAEDRRGVSAFVRGIKNLNLWELMVCWPLRSTQNAGTGTTAYSLGGLGRYDGTLVNGPTWGGDGVTADSTLKCITTSLNKSNYASRSLFVVFNINGALSAANPDSRGRLVQTGLAENVFVQYTPDCSGIGMNATVAGGGSTAVAYSAVPADQQVGITGVPLSSDVWQSMTSVFGARQLGVYKNGSFNNLSPVGGAWADSVTDPFTLRMFQSADMDSTSGGFLGSIAFVADLSSAIQAQQSAFYSLYKSTLGQGLGLP